MDSSRDQPLMNNNNGYPIIGGETSDYSSQPVEGQVLPNDATYQQGYPNQYPNQQNQGYQNQGYQNQGYQNQGYQNQNQGYQNQGYQNQGYQNQGYQNQGYPPGQGQAMPPPGMVAGNGIGMNGVNIPTFIAVTHPHYGLIMEQCNMPCSVCSFTGGDIVTMEPGCAAISWAICLYICTGILCFWIPLVASGCKDIQIRCSKCSHIKFVIEKSCC